MTLLGRPSAFVGSIWLQADGDARPVREALLAAKTGCDRLGCTSLDATGRAVALVIDPRAFPEDCARATIILTRLAAPTACKPAVLIDRRVLDVSGAVAVTFRADGVTMRGTRDPSRVRPWDPPRRTIREGVNPPTRPAPAETSSAAGLDPREEAEATGPEPEIDQ